MRTFIAIEFPTIIHQQVSATRHALCTKLNAQRTPKILRWVAEQNIHLTLRFLGDTTPQQRHKLAAVLPSVCAEFAPFALSLGQVGAFPNVRQPRVLWMGVQDQTQQLRAVQAEIERAVQPIGFEAEARRFNPHVTLARTSRQATKRQEQNLGRLLQEFVAEQNLAAEQFRVEEVVHMQSELTKNGPVYTRVAAARFGKKGG